MVSIKRTSDSTNRAFPPRAPRRLKPTLTALAPLSISNINDGEVVHQQCLLLTGECPTFENSSSDHVSVKVQDTLQSLNSTQNWPAHQGKWKALVLLAPGDNTLTAEFHHSGGFSGRVGIKIAFQPLLQLPPLHLAIMVAKDSPLLVDCPPSKYGAFSSAHNSLDSAIAKLRMTALMWQALTAEDMREKGLGRRAFRLEEEWTADTVSTAGFSNSANGEPSMRSLPKVHIIRSDKTVSELRDPKHAQQNPNARNQDALSDIFTAALKAHGPPFESSYRPVIAGLVLDSHFSVEQDLILGHAAFGCHSRSGLSLGIFGSHLTYSWPRFLEEVPACLLDATLPGDTVGNDNREYNTIGQACWVGQGAFLHEVGHAFGAEHTTGIMARGYSQSWGHAFLATFNSAADHEAKWDLQDCLRFKTMPHFRLPGEQAPTKDFLSSDICIEVIFDQDHENIDEDEECDQDDEGTLMISATSGLAGVIVQNGDEVKLVYSEKTTTSLISINNFSTYDRALPLQITALAGNGKEIVVKNGWRLFKERSFINIPGSKIRLQKRSIKSSDLDDQASRNPEGYHRWTVLLAKADNTETIAVATKIDLRVGCTFDGAVVYYSNGTQSNCGPVYERDGSPYHFGGHASEAHSNQNGLEIVKVEIGQRGSWGQLDGIRMTDVHGHVWGELNAMGGDDRIDVLEPGSNEEIVGFFGTSHKHGQGFTEEFGIITAPKGVELPGVVWEMTELQNLGEEDEVASQNTVS